MYLIILYEIPHVKKMINRRISVCGGIESLALRFIGHNLDYSHMPPDRLVA